jgi:hypothetical protein
MRALYFASLMEASATRFYAGSYYGYYDYGMFIDKLFHFLYISIDIHEKIC